MFSFKKKIKLFKVFSFVLSHFRISEENLEYAEHRLLQFFFSDAPSKEHIFRFQFLLSLILEVGSDFRQENRLPVKLIINWIYFSKRATTRYYRRHVVEKNGTFRQCY